ncbi:SSI family serine proteinase inhibitor [Thermoactinospora rubra]|uniref:SSI family serine proteinase inhibitor n=1 Tax=Thermoactinospora rubra TaxID=1088767 RepID=UPI0013019ED1|nr:SSI family serine proteinase inhibitor [Thermoactinospora rubra]
MHVLKIAAVTASLLAAGPAPALAGRQPGAVLMITVTTGAAHAKSALLICGPAAGTHPKARAACRVLRKAGGDPARLSHRGAVCTKELRQHTVTVRGRWHGKRVAFMRTFGNECLMTAEGGALYTF